MASTPTERVFRRDGAVVLGAIAAVTAVAWAYLIRLATNGMGGDMPEMAMSDAGMHGSAAMASALRAWAPADFLMMFLMWSVMMIGMMLPSAAPTVLVHARIGREALRRGRPFAATGWFASGYLLAWVGFSAVATLGQWALERAALLSPMTMATGTSLGGVILVAAGLYQMTPLKNACLSRCQAPLVFIQQHGGFSPRPSGSLRLGLHHGLYCIGCCWALMAILFAVGVMNLLWVAAIAAFVLVEKVSPAGRALPRLAGVALVAAGTTMIL